MHASATVRAEPTTGGVSSILVVGDGLVLREPVTSNLEAEGFMVRSATGGHQVLDLAREMQPDLILLDVMMPGRDGLRVLSELRQDPQTARIPVVVLSARATDEQVREGWDAGADLYLLKPFDINELLGFLAYLTIDGQR